MKRSLHSLARLSGFSELQAMLYDKMHGAFHRFMKEESEVKELCVEIIRNLSRCNSNKVAIYSQLGTPLLKCLTSGETENIRRYAIGTVNNIATSEQIAMELMQSPQFLDTVVGLIKTGATSTIKERAIWTLQSLACVDENEIALYNSPEIVSTLISCLDRSETIEVQSYAVETLRNLAPRNQHRMAVNYRLLHGLMDLVSHGRESHIRSLALSCFERMGLDQRRVNGIQVLTSLSSVKMIPRLAFPRCYFRVLPGDLLRKIRETLGS